MKTRVSSRKPVSRLNTGDTLLRNAESANTRAVKGRLDAFAQAHRSYGEAHAKADEEEKAFVAQQAELIELDTQQDNAIEALALALTAAGHSRSNPFLHFGALAPGKIKSMPMADEAGAIHSLAATLRRSKSLPQAVRNVVEQADQAAHALEAALPMLETRRNHLKVARSVRDSLAQSWDGELARLRLATRSAAIEAPGLYEALFGRPVRARKGKTAGEQPATEPAPAAASEVQA